ANQSPDLRGVDAEYARRMGLVRGVKAGIDAWKKNDMAELGRVFDDLSPVEQNEFRTGLAGQLINLLGGANTGRDMARVLEQASPSMAAKLRIIFPGDEVFNAYMDRVSM